ncbi:molecular chaperone DnaJ [Yinghuangia soli]|uniref:Chaperone protein DnaJ n=1 Tax=Yinghuangia soli TaxID=2908204 RepID=A0AA41PVI2_9ACTN|nr:molecular chaperone DnaJ [Yinghuangia soli]MCF2526643.1 molecular chaperone DnaJ [Yinghuangia soli]
MSTKDYLEKDFYKVLGVPKDAGAAEIKKAYRKLAREFHPDANKGDAKAEERFKEISEAYDVLADEKRRKEYDDARALFGNGGYRPPGPGGAGGFPFDLNDLFGQAGGPGQQPGGAGGIGDLFGGLFGRTGARQAQARRGQDVESEVTLNFTDAVDGATVPIRLTSSEPCHHCNGTGAAAGTMPRTCSTCSGTGQTSRNQGGFAFSEPCRDCKGRGLIVDDPCIVCHGSGRAKSARTMQVRVPAGVGDGQRIRLKGKGAPGERGGPAGDLYVVVHVRPHSVFGRKADNLTVTVPVTFPEAVLGAEVTVPTLGGAPVTLKLPAGTKNGATLRVRGRGAARKDGSRGDLLVTIEVTVPKDLDPQALEALEAYRAATASDDPRATLMEAAKGA